MSSSVKSDPRYKFLSDQGAEELEIYCNWLSDNQIKDSEENFIHFAVHRAELQDARHLFNVWESVVEKDNVPMDERLLVMRFLLNPTDDNFRLEHVAAWFDFIPLAHERGRAIRPTPVVRPEFKKVGFKM